MHFEDTLVQKCPMRCATVENRIRGIFCIYQRVAGTIGAYNQVKYNVVRIQRHNSGRRHAISIANQDISIFKQIQFGNGGQINLYIFYKRRDFANWLQSKNILFESRDVEIICRLYLKEYSSYFSNTLTKLAHFSLQKMRFASNNLTNNVYICVNNRPTFTRLRHLQFWQTVKLG